MLLKLMIIVSLIATSVAKNRTVSNTSACNSPDIIQQAYETSGNFICIEFGDKLYTNRLSNDMSFEEIATQHYNAALQPIPNEIFIKYPPNEKYINQIIQYYKAVTVYRARIYYGNDKDNLLKVKKYKLKKEKFKIHKWTAYMIYEATMTTQTD